MAARLNRKHSEDIRKKIQAAVILERYQKHFRGEIELTATQIKVGDSLLDRSVPKLQQIQLTGEDGGPVEIREVVRRIV